MHLILHNLPWKLKNQNLYVGEMPTNTLQMWSLPLQPNYTNVVFGGCLLVLKVFLSIKSLLAKSYLLFCSHIATLHQIYKEIKKILTFG